MPVFRLTRLLVFLIFYVMFSMEAMAEYPLEGNVLGHQNLIKIEILEDPEGLLDINDVTGPSKSNDFRSFTETSFNFGFTTITLWLRFTLPEYAREHLSYLEVVNPYIDLVRLYIPANDNQYNIQQAGDSIPFHVRPHSFRTFVFDLGEATDIDETRPNHYVTGLSN